MDITPLIPKSRKVINGYGDGGFTISGERIEGSLFVFPNEVINWEITAFEKLSQKSFTVLIERSAQVEILLLGCGKNMQFLPMRIEEYFRSRGIVTDVMDTGAACRTYNVLLSEEREVAAALIAV